MAPLAPEGFTQLTSMDLHLFNEGSHNRLYDKLGAHITEIDGHRGTYFAVWAPDAERELRKIPFFVRGKARRNTEKYATEKRLALITVETLYDAKAHFAS